MSPYGFSGFQVVPGAYIQCGKFILRNTTCLTPCLLFFLLDFPQTSKASWLQVEYHTSAFLPTKNQHGSAHPTMSRLGSLPANLCAHLQNTSRSFHPRACIPYTNSALAISNILLRSGLVSNISLGSPAGPDPASFNTLPIPAKKLWIGLKHRDGQPVLRRMNLVSKPSFRVVVSKEELGRLLVGKRARNVPGVGIGEILIVKTPEDRREGRTNAERYMEGWEAFRAGLGGEVICRVA